MVDGPPWPCARSTCVGGVRYFEGLAGRPDAPGHARCIGPSPWPPGRPRPSPSGGGAMPMAVRPKFLHGGRPVFRVGRVLRPYDVPWYGGGVATRMTHGGDSMAVRTKPVRAGVPCFEWGGRFGPTVVPGAHDTAPPELRQSLARDRRGLRAPRACWPAGRATSRDRPPPRPAAGSARERRPRSTRCP